MAVAVLEYDPNSSKRLVSQGERKTPSSHHRVGGDSSVGAVVYRKAAAGDLPAEYSIFVAALTELHQRHAVPWIAPQLAHWAAVHQHLLRHDGERSFVAEHEGRVVGFSAALVRGDLWFFSWLFIHPEFQGQGIGRRLFDLSRDGPYARQVTITDAIQPVSTGMYAQQGLVPATPILNFGGQPTLIPPPGIEAATPRADAIAAVDSVAYRCDRAIDHEFWREHARLTLWVRDGAPVAYSYARPDGFVGPVAGLDPAAAAGALRAELARLNGQEVRVMIPGTSRELVEVAFAARLRFSTMPGLLQLSRT